MSPPNSAIFLELLKFEPISHEIFWVYFELKFATCRHFWFQILSSKKHQSGVKQSKDIFCYFLNLLSHKLWTLTRPVPYSRPGRRPDTFDIQVNLELLFLRKNSQRKHIYFGIIENWDQKRPFRSRAPHFLPVFYALFYFLFYALFPLALNFFTDDPLWN